MPELDETQTIDPNSAQAYGNQFASQASNYTLPNLLNTFKQGTVMAPSVEQQAQGIDPQEQLRQGLQRRISNVQRQQEALLADQPEHTRAISNIIGAVGNTIGARSGGAVGLLGALVGSLPSDMNRKREAQQKALDDEMKRIDWEAKYASLNPKQTETAIKHAQKEQELLGKQAIAERKNDITEQYHRGLLKTRDFLAQGQVEKWKADSTEAHTYHQGLLKQHQWIRESINSLERDKLELDRYIAKRDAGKITADETFREQKLKREMGAKLAAINAGIQKTNIANQILLGKVNPKTGKPVIVDENGNVPTYTPIPEITPQQEEETSSIAAFPEIPELSQMPAPPAMQATAQTLPSQSGMQPGIPPVNVSSAPGTMLNNNPQMWPQKPPWGPELDRAATGSKPPQSGAARKVTSLKQSEAMAKPQNRDKAKDKYHQLIGQGMDPKAAFSQARKEFPY